MDVIGVRRWLASCNPRGNRSTWEALNGLERQRLGALFGLARPVRATLFLQHSLCWSHCSAVLYFLDSCNDLVSLFSPSTLVLRSITTDVARSCQLGPHTLVMTVEQSYLCPELLLPCSAFLSSIATRRCTWPTSDASSTHRPMRTR